MRIKTFLCCTVFFAAASAGMAQQGIITKTSNRVEVVFTNQMTQEELINIQNELKLVYMLDLEYTTANFNDEGKLRDLSFTAKTNDGHEVTYAITGMKDNYKILLFKNFGQATGDSAMPNFGVGHYPLPDAVADPQKTETP